MTTPLPSSAAYGRWLAILRILTGAMWLSHGIPKFTHSAEFMPGSGAIDCGKVTQTQVPVITNYICLGMQHTQGPYHQFLVSVVAPNIGLFAEAVRLGEVLVGLSLVLGVAARFGGLGGMLLTLNYMAARGHLLSSTTLQSLDFGTFVLSMTCLVLPTGRVFGVDALWSRRKAAPPTPTVRAEFVPEPPLDHPTAPTT